MNNDDLIRSEIVNEWLEKAYADFYSAEKMLELNWPYRSIIAYHAQQAVEKFLKSYLIYRKTEFPRTHNIERLLHIINEIDSDLYIRLKDAGELSQYATDTRYPGLFPEITQDDAVAAVVLARLVCNHVAPRVKGEESND